MATAPQYAAEPVMWVAYNTAANPNRDGNGVLVPLGIGAASGTRISIIIIQSIAATQAGMMRFYLAGPSASQKLWLEVPMLAVTPSASVPAFRQTVALQGGIVVPPGWTLSSSIQNANPTFAHAFGSNF